MTGKNISIKATVRNTGKGASHKLRTSALIPAVIYGPKVDNENVSIALNDAIKYTAHGFENQIFNLDCEGSKTNAVNVLVKNVDRHPGTHLPIHIDFYAPNMTETVKVNVELRFEGKAKGEAEGGIVNTPRKEIEVECLPNEIPDHISVDISALDINGSIHVSEITIPEGSKLITSPDLTVATCAVIAEEPEAVAEEAPVAEGEAAPAGDAPAAAAEKK